MKKITIVQAYNEYLDMLALEEELEYEASRNARYDDYVNGW